MKKVGLISLLVVAMSSAALAKSDVPEMIRVFGCQGPFTKGNTTIQITTEFYVTGDLQGKDFAGKPGLLAISGQWKKHKSELEGAKALQKVNTAAVGETIVVGPTTLDGGEVTLTLSRQKKDGESKVIGALDVDVGSDKVQATLECVESDKF